MIWKFLQNQVNFSKRELNGITVLLVILILIILFPIVYRPDPFSKEINIIQFKKEVAEFERSITNERRYSYRDAGNRQVSTHPTYFNFDPNGLPPADWKRLGLSDKQIRVIQNYEAKGGRFYTKQDVQKMYVISPELYQKLEPYIHISTTKTAITSARGKLKVEPVTIDLNTADSIQLQKINGIGPAFASRIIRYRDRLGGFYNIGQLREVYGIDSLKYNQIAPQLRLSPSAIKKININTAVFDDLKRHPYLNYKQLNAILQYRKQHGEFQDLQDLKKVLILSDEILHKIEPYLTFK